MGFLSVSCDGTVNGVVHCEDPQLAVTQSLYGSALHSRGDVCLGGISIRGWKALKNMIRKKKEHVGNMLKWTQSFTFCFGFSKIIGLQISVLPY